MSLQEILAEFDRAEKKHFTEKSFAEKLDELDFEVGNPPLEIEAEMTAFTFTENYKNHEGSYHGYFGPGVAAYLENGSLVEVPTSDVVSEDLINYWLTRAAESINPILKARYTGLVFDFHEKITGKRPEFKIVTDYIEALLNIAEQNYQTDAHSVYQKLARALSVSLSFKNADLIQRSKAALIKYEQENSDDEKGGSWGHSFDLILDNPKSNPSKEETDAIIDDLEKRLQRLLSSTNNQNAPWAVEAVSVRLARFYKKTKREDEVKRVVIEIGNAFEKIIPNSSAMQVSAWLDHLHNIYVQFGLKDEAAAILFRSRENAKTIPSEMKELKVPLGLTAETVQAFTSEVTSGSTFEALKQIAITLIIRSDQTEAQVLDLVKTAPISFLFPHELTDEKGRTVAKIGPLKEDLKGHVVLQMSKNMQLTSFFLRPSIEKLVSEMKLGTAEVLQFVNSASILDPDRLPVYELALNSYFKEEYTVFLHLIIPQIENLIRTLAESSGIMVLKPKNGIYQLRNLDEILRDENFRGIFDESFCDYLSVLLTDARGWNLRNHLCHGISNPEIFNVNTADRVLHAFLCFGLVYNKE